LRSIPSSFPPTSAFLDIHKLPACHVLEFEGGKLSVQQYCDVPEYGTHQLAGEEDCLEELEYRLAEAVRIRLIADVPLGALLSGGGFVHSRGVDGKGYFRTGEDLLHRLPDFKRLAQRVGVPREVLDRRSKGLRCPSSIGYGRN
jgi:hypothetical protein